MTHRGTQRLSPRQIVAVARAAGFSPTKKVPGMPYAQDVVWTAIALAESTGNIYAHNPNPPDDSYGLWQINMLGDLGPDRRARYNLRSNEELFDPATNARVAYSLSNQGTNTTPWATAPPWSQIYLRHIGTAQRAATQAGTGLGGNVLGNIPESGSGGGVQQAGLPIQLPGLAGVVQDLVQLFGVAGEALGVDAIKNITEEIQGFFLRSAAFIIGSSLLVLAFILFVLRTTAGDIAKKFLKKRVPL